MTRLLIVLILTLPCIAAAAEESAAAIIGRWSMIGFTDKPIDTTKFQIEWEFTRDEIIVRDRERGEEVSRNRYTVDTTKSPAWITVAVAGPAPETRLGIFRLHGDELHLKQQIGAGERPVEFDGSYGILRRIESLSR